MNPASASVSLLTSSADFAKVEEGTLMMPHYIHTHTYSHIYTFSCGTQYAMKCMNIHAFDITSTSYLEI